MLGYTRVITFSVLILSGCALTQGEMSAEEKEIRSVLTEYIVGWREGEADRLSEIFAVENGQVYWISDNNGTDELNAMSFEEVLKNRKPQTQYGLDWKVESLDIVEGELAFTRLYISRAGGSYIDFLILQKINEHWKIIHKSFVTTNN